MSDDFLNTIHEGGDAEDVAAFYDAWADRYETEIQENGYASPGRCARALASFVSDKSLPVLDFGCGTGLSGLSLRLEGFVTLDGMDLSADMLAQAQEKQVYRSLRHVSEDTPLDDLANYGAIAAIGVIGPGAAPPPLLDALFNAMSPKGLLVFSMNDNALADPSYEGRLNEYLDHGALRLLFNEHGEHLPGLNLKSRVYVVEKT